MKMKQLFIVLFVITISNIHTRKSVLPPDGNVGTGILTPSESERLDMNVEIDAYVPQHTLDVRICVPSG